MAPSSEKDRLGDKLKDLEHAREDLYFAGRERQLIERMRNQAAHPVRAEVVDLMALVRAVADGSAPLAALKPDLAFLDEQAAQAGEALAIPGVRAVRTDAP